MNENKKYVVISGCSFSGNSGGSKNHGNISWSYYFKDLIETDDVKVEIVAVPGVGNFIIYMNCMSMVNTLIKQGVDPKNIFVITQWSGLFRPTHYYDGSGHKSRDIRRAFYFDMDSNFGIKSAQIKAGLKFITGLGTKYWDSFTPYYNTSQAFMETLNDILKLQWYLKSVKVKYKMFTGWDIFTIPKNNWSEGKSFGASHMLRPQQFAEKDEYENKENKILSEVYPVLGVFWDMIDFKNFWFFENEKVKYGGLTQWTQNTFEDYRFWYLSFPHDVHPSNDAAEKFANEVMLDLYNQMLGS